MPDPSHPELIRYLASLPQGVDSYPECTVRAAPMNAALDLIDLEGTEGLPEPVRVLVSRALHRSAMVPEAHFLAFLSWLRDERFDSEEGFLTFTDAVFHRFYAMPLYRIAFLMGRPAEVAESSSRIWGWLRRGTRLEVTGRGDQHVWLRLTSPPHLFDALHGRVLARGLGIAYRLAHDHRDLRVSVADQTPTELRLKVEWTE